MKKIVVLLAAISVAGCSALRPGTEIVNIGCTEPGVTLLLNGTSHPCPTQTAAPRNRDVSIHANKPGYFPYIRTIGYHLNGTGALDAVGTLLVLVPAIGLLTPGAWSLDETTVNITLVPAK
jgi:hypothetical protein